MKLGELGASISLCPCAQKVNERLAANVLRNWERFVEGLHDVTIIQRDVEARR